MPLAIEPLPLWRSASFPPRAPPQNIPYPSTSPTSSPSSPSYPLPVPYHSPLSHPSLYLITTPLSHPSLYLTTNPLCHPFLYPITNPPIPHHNSPFPCHFYTPSCPLPPLTLTKPPLPPVPITYHAPTLFPPSHTPSHPPFLPHVHPELTCFKCATVIGCIQLSLIGLLRKSCH